jgi:hypothetical protein
MFVLKLNFGTFLALKRVGHTTDGEGPCGFQANGQ